MLIYIMDVDTLGLFTCYVTAIFCKKKRINSLDYVETLLFNEFYSAMTIDNEKQPFTLEEVINYSLEEAEEALNNPYQFKHPIKNVAVIGAGPSGVKYSKRWPL